MLWLYDEMRKLYVRKGRQRLPTGQIKLTGWVARNTYYRAKISYLFSNLKIAS